MGKIYLSFLGLGTKDDNTGEFSYRDSVYELNGRESKVTKFVQGAEIEILGARSFDRILIALTEKSRDTHFQTLEKQLTDLGVKKVETLILSEEMTPEGQWGWFEKILSQIERGDHLTVDMTHGYRSMPIVFSAAIHFLQRARDVKLEAVYYGAYDKNRELSPIVDMKQFYVINDWAEAVSRVVEDADARKMAQMAETAPAFQSGGLSDPHLIQALDALTNRIRNVDINNLEEPAKQLLRLIEEKEQEASETGRILLGLVKDKFAPITREQDTYCRYNVAYFRLQLSVIRLLLEHGLFMQAYTVMREFIGSMGLVQFENVLFNNAKGRKKRQYAETFVNMIQHEREGWKFEESMDEKKEKLLPHYECLEGLGVVKTLDSFIEDLLRYRNGFDHAWTGRNGSDENMKDFGFDVLEQLSSLANLLNREGIIPV